MFLLKFLIFQTNGNSISHLDIAQWYTEPNMFPPFVLEKKEL